MDINNHIVTKLACPGIIAAIILLSGCGKKTAIDNYQDLSDVNIYKQGQVNITQGKYKEAIADFEALEAQYPYGNFTTKGQIALIESYYKNGNYIAALANVERFVRMYPKHQNADKVLYLQGLSLYDQTFSFVYKHLPLDRSIRDKRTIEKAFYAFKNLVHKYPKSEYNADAKTKMQELHDMLANHELHIAQYYMKRKAYIAVINRSKNIIKNFKNTPAATTAAELLNNAYNQIKISKSKK